MRLLVTLVLLLLAAAPAHAATVRVDREVYDDFRDDIHTTTLVYRAGTGERNRVRVDVRGRTVTVVDAGARLRPGRHCRALTRHRARCRLDRRLDPFFHAFLGDRDDRFREASRAGFVYDVLGGRGADRITGGPGQDLLAGEAGDDVLRGGGGADELRDGPGRDAVDAGAGRDLLLSTDARDPVADRFDGGAGPDLLSYRTRRERVAGRLGGRAGERGEHDRMTAVEGLRGGARDDVLRGTDGPDLLDGGPGPDRLYGYGGDDGLRLARIDGDVVFAGPGDDTIAAGNPDEVAADAHCGPGRDRANVADEGFLLRPDRQRAVDPYQGVRLASRAALGRRRIALRLPCAYADRPAVRRVHLTAAGRSVAEGRRGAGKGVCRVVLRVALLLRHARVVHLHYYGDPRWSFVLRP